MTARKRPTNRERIDWAAASKIKVSGTDDEFEVEIAKEAVSSHRRSELLQAIGSASTAAWAVAEKRSLELASESQRIEEEKSLLDNIQATLDGIKTSTSAEQSSDELFTNIGDWVSLALLKSYAISTKAKPTLASTAFGRLTNGYVSNWGDVHSYASTSRATSQLEDTSLTPAQRKLFHIPTLTEEYTAGVVGDQLGIGARTDQFIGNFLDDYYKQNPRVYKELDLTVQPEPE
jgi:hypothetical protein